uniref:NADH-ubiquinone oxidoreductase chain 2 n=1 Tax=Echinoderes svetlanae TaxID=1912903 RepID=A0A1I9VTU3_9BILA|nr:NADH dehydrogenase subunit 2 [Echinoderes svetlanae]APA17416.1 NADH dehydrogenase subunit 2 [Echinoderes svetlanae]
MRNMFMLHFISLFVFILSLIYSLSSLTWLGCWIGMEVGNLMMYIWFNINSLNRNIIVSSMYYWVSGISGFGLLGCYFCYSMYPILSMIGFMFFFVFKMGLFPFYGWVLMIFKRLDYFIFFMLSSILKLPLIMLMDYFFNLGFTLLIIFGFIFSYLSLFVGVSGLSQMSLKGIMGYSSINVVSDFFISYMLSYDLFIFVFVNYMLILIGMFILLSLNINNIQNFYIYGLKGMNDNNKSYEMIFLALFGMPLFLSFYIKFYMSFYFLHQGYSFINLILFFLLMLVACLNYYRCWSYYNNFGSYNYGGYDDGLQNYLVLGYSNYYYFLLSFMFLGYYMMIMMVFYM